MAGYTPAEIEAAVSQFVKSSVAVTKDVLGPIDLSARFDEVMELFASTLMLDPNSLFYVIFLASNKLCADVTYAVSLVDDILRAIEEIGYTPTKITGTSLLGDAAAQLAVMDVILSRYSVVNEFQHTAYDQYVSSVDAFRDTALRPNITNKKAKDPLTGKPYIVRAAQEARLSAVNSLTELRALYPDILARAGALEDAKFSLLTIVDSYKGLRLPAVALQRSLRRARGDLLALQQAFNDQTTSEEHKTALTRDAYLRITAGKSVITGLKEVRSPTSPRMSSSPINTGSVSIPSPSGSLTVASVLTNVAPWAVRTGVSDTVIISEDGQAPTTYTIPVSPIPSVMSFNDTGGVFDIHTSTFATITGALGPYNIPAIDNKFYVTVDGRLFSGHLTDGIRTTDQIVTDMRALTDSSAVRLDQVVSVTNAGGALSFSHMTAGPRSLQVTDDDQAGHGYLVALGLAVTSATGTAANNKLSIDQTPKLPVPLPLVVLGTGSRTVNAVVADINSWAIGGGYSYHATAAGNLIQISNTSAGAASITMRVPYDVDKDVVLGAYRTIGFYEGQTDSSTSVSAAELAKVFNDVGKIRATVVRDSSGDRVRLESKLATLGTLLTVGSGTANSLLGLVPGMHAGTTTGFTATANFENADVVVGDILVVGTDFIITSVTANLIDVTPPLPTNRSISSFRIESADSREYDQFVLGISSWIHDNLGGHPEYASNTLELDRLLNPVLGGATPTESDVNDAIRGATDLKYILEHSGDGHPQGLSEVLVAYVTRTSPRIDAAINMLHERGLDRSYDTLMDGDIAGFFGYSKDDAASAAYMLKAMRSVVQNDLPVTSRSDEIDDTALETSVQTSDANYDRSDVDKDENIKILGSVPDLDTDATVPQDYYKTVF